MIKLGVKNGLSSYEQTKTLPCTLDYRLFYYSIMYVSIVYII